MSGGPDWLTRPRAFALAALAGLFLVAIISLSMILGAGGGDDEQPTVAAEETAAATPEATPTPTPTATPEPTPVPLTPEQRAEREAAADQVEAQGYEPVNLRAYHPDQTLRVLLGEPSVATRAAGVAEGRRAFFFVGGDYIGTDAAEPSAELRILDQTQNTVTLRYGLSTGEDARVRFKWADGSLAPQQAVPPAAARQSG